MIKQIKKVTSVFCAILMALSIVAVPVGVSAQEQNYTVTLYPLKDQPEIEKLSSTQDGVQIEWAPTKNATGYKLLRSTSANKDFKTIKAFDATSKTNMFTDKDVINGTTYYYKIFALIDNKSFIGSDVKAIGFLISPEIKSLSNVPGGVKIIWDKTRDATGYKITRKLDSENKYTAIAAIKSGDAGSYIDSTTDYDKKYTYKIHALINDTKFISSDAKEISTSKATMAPEITNISNEYDGVKIEWTPVKGASLYNVFKRIDPKNNFALITSFKDRFSFVDDKVRDSQKIVYYIEACVGESRLHSESKSIVAHTYPQMQSISCIKDGVYLTFEKSDASRIVVFRGEGKNPPTVLLKSLKLGETSFIDKNVEDGKTYTYTIGTSKTKMSSNIKTIKFINPSINDSPKLTKAVSTANGVTVYFKKPQGASLVKVFKEANGKWVGIGVTSGTNFVDRDVKSGTTYKYTARCVDAIGQYISLYDTKGISITYLIPSVKESPKLTKISNTVNGITVVFNKIPNINRYRVFKEVNGKWAKVGDTDKTFFTDNKNLTANTTYKYTVRGIDDSGNFISEYDTKGISIKWYPPVAKPTITNTDKGQEIKWKKIPGVKYYGVFAEETASNFQVCVEVMFPGTLSGITNKNKHSWVGVGFSSSDRITNTRVNNGSSYNYVILPASKNSPDSFLNGYTEAGIAAATYCLAPTISSITNVLGGQEIKINKVSGVSKYALFVKGPSDKEWKGLCKITGTSYINKSVSSNNKYTYTIRACNYDGDFISGYSEAGKSSVYYAAPKQNTLKIEGNTIHVNWDSIKGITVYRVYMKTSANGEWESLGDYSGNNYWYKTPSDGQTYYFTIRCVKSGTVVSGYTGGRNIKYTAPSISSSSSSSSSSGSSSSGSTTPTTTKPTKPTTPAAQTTKRVVTGLTLGNKIYASWKNPKTGKTGKSEVTILSTKNSETATATVTTYSIKFKDGNKEIVSYKSRKEHGARKITDIRAHSKSKDMFKDNYSVVYSHKYAQNASTDAKLQKLEVSRSTIRTNGKERYEYVTFKYTVKFCDSNATATFSQRYKIKTIQVSPNNKLTYYAPIQYGTLVKAKDGSVEDPVTRSKWSSAYFGQHNNITITK